MLRHLQPQLPRLLLGALPVALLALAAPQASAQANLAFGGGSGSPLSITLTAPVTYTVDVPINSFPIFLFDGVTSGNAFGSEFTGTLTYTINGSGSYVVNLGTTGNSGGAETQDDLLLFSSATPNVTGGDVVVLRAGTITSKSNFADAAPASRNYATFMLDSGGNPISPIPAATAAPEPGTIALLLSAGVPVAGLVRRRNKR